MTLTDSFFDRDESGTRPAAPARRDDDDAPLSELDEEDLLHTVKKHYRADLEHWSSWQEQAAEDYEYAAGHQWSEADRREMENQLRPIVTFNRIGTTVDSVTGLEINNRRVVRYLPREMGDAKANELLTGAADWCRDQTDAEDEETDAFWDLLVCGMGWVDNRVDYEEDPAGKFVVDRIDPFEMLADAKARKRNLVDARHLFRIRKMSLADARALVPDSDQFDDADFNASWVEGGRSDEDDTKGNPRRAYLPLAGESVGDDDDEDGDDITLVQFKWWERVPYWLVRINGREVEVGSDAEYRALIARGQMQSAMMGLPFDFESLRATRKRFMQAWIGRVVLSVGPCECPTHFGWECLTGKRDQSKGTWYGLVRPMRDPQQWANKWLSQTMHILNSNAKGGMLYEAGVFEDVKKAERDWARPDRFIEVRPGALSSGSPQLQPRQPGAFPAGFPDLLQFAVSSIRDVSGVNLELLGLAERQQAGVLENERKQAAVTILAGLFDALRRFRKRQGDILLYFIQHHLADGRLVRIVGEEGERYVPLVLQADTKFDVIVDDATSSPNMKEKTWTQLQQILPSLAGMLGPEDMLALAEYALPTSVVEKLRGIYQKKQQAEAESAQQAQQIQMQQMQADVAKTQAEAQKTQAQAAAEIEKIKSEGQAGWLEVQKQQAAVSMEQLKLGQQRDQALLDAQLKRDEMLLAHNLKRREVGLGDLSEDGLEQPTQTDLALQAIMDQLGQVQAGMAAPREVIRDETGAVVGAVINGVRQDLVRGPDGRVAGMRPSA